MRVLIKNYEANCYIAISLLSIFLLSLSFETHAQNIFLEGSSGIHTFGKYSYMNNSYGPATGINYSFNGTTAIGISYSSILQNRQHYKSFSIIGNMLVNKQSEGNLINFEVVPIFERKFNEVSKQYFSLFSFGTRISRDFSSESKTNLIPRASFSYLMSPSVGISNYFSTGLDLNIGYDLSKNIKFIIDPGVIFRLDKGQANSTITCGFLIH